VTHTQATTQTPRGRGHSSPAILAWLRLARVFQRIDRATAEQLRQWDLTVPQFDVLVQIARTEAIAQQELAAHLLVTKGNISQLIERMERGELVSRERDGLTKRVNLTERGWELHDASLPAQEALIERLLAALTLEEQEQLHTLLRKLDYALADRDGATP
jgi:DNA-binding MarR family transcriptional regulator